MTAPIQPRIGQVWAAPDGTVLALIINVAGDHLTARDVTGPHVGEVHHHPVAEFTREWTFRSENARLRCINPDAALAAARFLTGHGLLDVLVDGDVVSAPLTVGSVMQFADDAFNNGWAHDAECARMIGDLG